MLQRHSCDAGLLGRMQKLITHKLQSDPSQERGGGGLAPLTKPGLQRAQADAEMISNVRCGDWRDSVVNQEPFGACSSSALQEVWGPPVPPAAYPRGYPYSPGYNYSYGGVARCARHTDRRITKQVRQGCPRS